MTEDLIPEPLHIDYYTDVLCIWAYLGQVRVDQLQREFGARIHIRYRFISLFGDTATHIGEGWADGGFAGYSAAVRGHAAGYPHVQVHPDIWRRNVPASSMPAHLLLKAVQLLDTDTAPSQANSPSRRLAGRMRTAFFAELQDISDAAVLDRLLLAEGIDPAAVQRQLCNGAAHAALATDMDARHTRLIEGSPTYVLNQGRQKLYGNLGYRAIAANIQELLDHPDNLPSWC